MNHWNLNPILTFQNRKHLFPQLAQALAIGLILPGCKFCSNFSGPTEGDIWGQSTIEPREKSHFGEHIFGICENKQKPLLYSHFLNQTIPKDKLLETILHDNKEQYSCPPGPFPVDKNKDPKEFEVWYLMKTPDYFVWHVSESTLSNQRIFITDLSGFPVKSQSLSLNLNDETILILAPKARLEPKKQYFLYLESPDGKNNTKWIQPIAVIEDQKALEKPTS